MDDCRLIHGEGLDVMRGMPADSADALVTDPPGGISFMGAEFDTFKSRNAFIDYLTPRLAEGLRVCRPGAVGLVWALPRTSHWTATAIEDSGWVLSDKLLHLFGTGFPKHRTHLKPAYEEWIVCRKPGPLWLGVGECKIGSGERPNIEPDRRRMTGNSLKGGLDGSLCGSKANGTTAEGRWPANLLLSHSPGCRLVGTKRVKGQVKPADRRKPPATNEVYGKWESFRDDGSTRYADENGEEVVPVYECEALCPIRMLDEQAGERSGPRKVAHRPGDGNGYNGVRTQDTERHAFSDSGGPSRFYATFPGEDTPRMFYCPKASKKDRGVGNRHPCTKSTALMEWLVRLACPPGGLVLDPFAGSGTTGLACLNTGRRCVLVEQEAGYVEIARKRLAGARGPLFSQEGAPGD